MSRRHDCWVIDNYAWRRSPRPEREFKYAVSLHNHSCHSVENLAALNDVVKLGFMRPLKGTLQRAFGLERQSSVNYAEMVYNPPLTPEDVYRMESDAVEPLGFDGVHLAITDHDEYAAGVALRSSRPDLDGRVAVAEEVSLPYRGHLFHLGVLGLAECGIEETHARIQSAARAERHDELFETLASTGCLVILNHPLVPWGPNGGDIPVAQLLARYGWAIHALEFNGMRRREENDRVLEMARHWRKPLIAGGDSHLLLASSSICVSQAASFADFIAEVKEGRCVPLIKSDYAAPLGWKLFLRVLYFMAHYRKIASFQGQPVSAMLARRRVLLDPVGHASRGFLALVSSLGLAR